jgi:hypothetical protein
MPPASCSRASSRCTRALRWCLIAGVATIAAALTGGEALGVTLAEKARESGCVNKPEVVDGTMYRCLTKSGVSSYFNVPGAAPAPAPAGNASGRSSASTPTPAGFPRIDTATQKGRDDVRRKVLSDELAAEEKLLADARTTYADGAPVPLPEERSSAEKYRERIARLRQAVNVHEKNVEALKKELQSVK